MTKPAISGETVRRLTSPQRNLLIDHIDGPVDVLVTNAHRVQCRNALIGLGLLRTSPCQAIRPRHTVLTERGRMAVGMVLGDYADALVRAGLLEQQNPLLVLQRLKAARHGDQPETPAELAVLMENAPKNPLPKPVI